MGNKFKKIVFWVVLGLAVLILAAAGLTLSWQGGLAVRMVNHYSGDFFQEEVLVMEECAECHEGPDFHRCSTCHDDHGAVEFADLPFYNLVSLTGDVPRPGYVDLNQILPYQDHPGTHINLVDFLGEQGVERFETVTLTSRDGGFVTISRENLTHQALLLPYMDGIRFAAEDLHVSTWLKGITSIIVVGEERDLIVNGEATSIGRLLLGPTRQVVVESARVMFASELDGEVREAQTAARVWGAALGDLVPEGSFTGLLVRTRAGEELRLSREQVSLAVLIPEVGSPTLVLPEESRSGWVKEVTELEWER